MDVNEVRDALHRIQMEYVEMPEMKLTLRQTRRLFNLSADACAVALATLVDVGFLVQSRDGTFLRSDGMMRAEPKRAALLPASRHARPTSAISSFPV